MSRILVTGGTGQVGHALRGLAWPAGVTPLFPDRTSLDLADPGSIESWLASERVAGIVSCGAYTAVDKAETDAATAWAVNAGGPAVLAAHAGRRGIPILQVSTDYVFDGTKPSPYVETDPVGPIGVYGASKEAGERAVREAAGDHAILRISWVYGPHGANFVRTMLRLGRERPVLRVVDDQHGSPTAASDAAEVVLTMILRMLDDPASCRGTWHFADAGETTWCDFARAIFEIVGADGTPVPAVEPIGTADYPTPARRPANSRLDTTKIGRELGIRPRPWREALAAVLPGFPRP